MSVTEMCSAPLGPDFQLNDRSYTLGMCTEYCQNLPLCAAFNYFPITSRCEFYQFCEERVPASSTVLLFMQADSTTDPISESTESSTEFMLSPTTTESTTAPSSPLPWPTTSTSSTSTTSTDLDQISSVHCGDPTIQHYNEVPGRRIVEHTQLELFSVDSANTCAVECTGRGTWCRSFNYRRGDGRCCLLYTSPSPRDRTRSRMPSSA